MDDERYDARWWFGKNSIWSQSGAKEHFTGAVDEGKKGMFGDFRVPMEIDLSDEMKLTIGVVIFVIVGAYLAK